MRIYTVKKKIIKKILKGVRVSTERSKIRRSGVKDTANTNNNLCMSCYIHVECSVFFRW